MNQELLKPMDVAPSPHRQLAGEKVEERSAETVQVAACVCAGGVLRLLRSHELRCSNAAAVQPGLGIAVLGEDAGEPKIR